MNFLIHPGDRAPAWSQVRFLVGARGWALGQGPSRGVQEATNQCFSHTSMFLFLSFSLPSPLSKNKHITSSFKNRWILFSQIYVCTFNCCFKCLHELYIMYTFCKSLFLLDIFKIEPCRYEGGSWVTHFNCRIELYCMHKPQFI